MAEEAQLRASGTDRATAWLGARLNVVAVRDSTGPANRLSQDTWAVVEGRRWSDADIRALELTRARHALAYLTARIGNDAMRRLLAEDLATTTARVRGWVRASRGAWASARVELVVPAPSAQDFSTWYRTAMAGGHEVELRAGHPEHFVSHPWPDGVEVVENVGETPLPWRIWYRPLPDGEDYPQSWDPDCPVRFGAQLVDVDGLRVGYTMHALRDADDGTHVVMTTSLPAAAPAELLHHHLHHYAIEFRNWAHTAASGIAGRSAR